MPTLDALAYQRRAQGLGMLHRLAPVRHQEGCQPQVNAHGLACGRQGHDGHLADEHGVPPCAHALEGDRLDRATDPTVELDLERAHALDVQPVVFELAPVAVAGKGDAVEPHFALEAREAGRLARLHPPKEVLIGPVRSAADCLQHAEVHGRHVGALTADRFELVGLGAVVERDTCHAVRLTALQQAGVVDLARHVKLLLQDRALLIRGIQAVQVGFTRGAHTSVCHAA